MKVEIIAEIGENHKGDMEEAISLIHAAADCGVDTVKFQSYNKECLRDDDPDMDWFMKVQLSDQHHFMLKGIAESDGLKFLSSPFSKERASFLVNTLGCSEIKIASAMFYQESFLEYVNTIDKLKVVYLSTGLSNDEEVDDAMFSVRGKKINLMHCVSLYPCGDGNTNLTRIFDFENEGWIYIGYSDHTIGIDACLFAVGAGARIIEKHFTLDKNDPIGTDHIISADVVDMKRMVDSIRRAEKMFEDNVSTQEMIDNKKLISRRFPN